MIARFAVIGSNSFSGSHFVARLLADGHTVLGLSRSPEVPALYRAYQWHQPSERFTFKQADLNEVESVASALSNFNPEIVVNFAAQSMVAQSWDYPEHWYRTNVLGIVELAKVLDQLPELHRYVHVTTPEVYGSTGGWISESDNFRPSTPYAISRAAGDMHLAAMHEVSGLKVCFTRAANVYGPGQPMYRIIPRALLFARLGRRLRLDGGGQSTRSFIHIADVADATLRIATSGTPGQSYHISTNEIVSIKDLVKKVCQLTDIEYESLVEVGPERAGKDDTYMLNSDRLRRELAWSPSINLDTGLGDTLAWVDANLAELATEPDGYVHKE